MPQRTTTTHLSTFTRPAPAAVAYDLSNLSRVTITLPPHSTWTSGLHWHETHTEYLQVEQGRILVTLGSSTKEYSPGDGVIEILEGTLHEWRRIPDDDDVNAAVVHEWTVPSDGQKEVFFRMLNSFLLEEAPQKLYRPLPLINGMLQGSVERWTVECQLFTIFRSYDNFPVLLGTGGGSVSRMFTRVVLMLASWIGWLLGIEAVYPEYVGEDLKARL